MVVSLTRYYLLILSCFLLSQGVVGQSIYEKYNIYRNPVRVFLNKFSVTLTTGYSRSTYSHDFSGVNFYQDSSRQFIFSNESGAIGPSITGYTNWLNNPQLDSVPNTGPGSQAILLNTDSVALGFRRGVGGIPVTLNIHYSFLDFRVGGGFTWERQFIKEFEPTSLQGLVRNYQPNFKSTSYTRWYGLVGYKFHSFWTWDFVAEVQLGKFGQGKQFDKSAITKGFYTNVGISFENNWSEYFRVVIRPSFDFKNYTVNLPDGASVQHRVPAFLMQVGVSINFPDIPRSPMKSDHVQLKHIYTDPKTGRLMEVRGQPITKRQNPKVGENHRRLWRYKRKNKKKLNPY